MYKIVNCTQKRFNIAKIKNFRFLSASSSRPEGPLFPHKDEFPPRHIGPRESDIITMLDTLGFKVSIF